MVSSWGTCWHFSSLPRSSIPGKCGQEDLISLPLAGPTCWWKLLQAQKHEDTGSQLPLPQLTQCMGVLHHEARAEETRDPTAFPPASATHRVGRSLLGKKVATPPPPLWCSGAELLPRGTFGHKTMSSTALLEETDLLGAEHGEFHPTGII